METDDSVLKKSSAGSITWQLGFHFLWEWEDKFIFECNDLFVI